MNYYDLFSGIGGFAFGAWLAGFRFDNHFFSETDKKCIEHYGRRFPDAVGLGDIRQIKAADLLQGPCIVTGGFPCQDISRAGKKAGIHGSRSGLWFEMWRIIGYLRPRFAIIENVGDVAFRGLDRVLCGLAEIGYYAEWQDIRASDMGAPHQRERIWVVAYPYSDMYFQEKPGELQQAEGQAPAYGTGNSTARQPGRTSQGRIPSEGSGIRNRYREWWRVEPGMDRMVNGIPDRVDRIKGLGNLIVPQIAATIFNLIKPYCEGCYDE